MLDFVLFTCSYGQVCVPTIVSVERLHNSNLRFEWWFQTDDALISRSRSIAVTHFLKKNRSPNLLFLDGDIIFYPADVQKVIDALNSGCDVVGGLYPVKGAKYLAQRGFDGRLPITGEVEEAQFVSTGFLGISRRILEKIVEGMPLLNEGTWAECYPVFEAGRYEQIYISEDWDFPLALDTNVLMSDFTWKPLGEVAIGDSVVGFGGPNRNHRPYGISEVIDTVEQSQDLYRIITTDGEIQATAKHPLLASSPCGASTRWLTTERLQHGQHLVKPIEPVTNPNKNDNEYKIGYLKGLWAGDGSINGRGYGTLQMVDREAIERAHQFSEDLGLRVGDVKERRLNNPNWKPLWGFYCGSGMVEIRQRPMQSQSFAQGFLAGIYDAEGSYRSGLLRIANKDEAVIDEIRGALALVGIASIPKMRPDGLQEFAFSTQARCHRFWQSTTPAITRKISLNGQGANGHKVMQSRHPTILSIEKIGKRDVRCLTTTTGNFIANGFASHNCNKAREAGAKIYAHTGVQLAHIKEAIYTSEEAIANMRVETGSITDELKEYLGHDLLPEAQTMSILAERWKARKGTAEEFYKDPEVQDLYLYDLAWFNSAKLYHQSRLDAVKNAQGKNVLDMGCGIGTALLELGPKNKKLVGYDLNDKALDFARYRATKLGVRNVTFTSEWPDVGEFDLILATDVLEHIEDLGGFLKRLGSEMKSGARLYHVDVFWNQDKSPMHFDHSQNVDQWLREAGLVIFDNHWCVKP